jgi:RimJ/RimL family protein N-acetyltransferase
VAYRGSYRLQIHYKGAACWAITGILAIRAPAGRGGFALNGSVMIPVIETPRLLLRGHGYDDLPACVAMWSEPDVTKFITGRASTEAQTWARLLSYLGHWQLMGFGYWAIVDKASGAFAGEAGLADFKRPVAASMKVGPELGFALASAFHGKGIATEAAHAVLAWADANLPVRTTVCLINPANAASLRVVEKCGYTVFEESTYAEQPALFLARNANGAAPAER